MTRLFCVLTLLALAAPLMAQPQPVLTPPKYATLPTTCSIGSLATKTTATAGLYVCSAANTWTIVTSGGSGAPTNATYITQTANSTLTAEQALGSLSTGLMNAATTTGVVSTLAPTDDNAVIGNGTAWELKALPSCSAGSSALSYNTTTNAFGCNTISGTFSGSLADTQVAFGTASNTIGGNANYKFISTAVSTPSAPTVTPQCVVAGMETCMSNEGYKITCSNAIGYTPLSSETTTDFTGPDTLTMSNYNHVAWVIPTGATMCYVVRYTNGSNTSDTGLIGTVAAPTNTLNDTGLSVTNAGWANNDLDPTNTTNGLLIGPYLATTDTATAMQWVAGSPVTAWSSDVLDREAFYRGRFVFSHVGTVGSATDPGLVIGVLRDTSDFGGIALDLASYTEGDNGPIGFASVAGQSGSHNNATGATAYEGHIRMLGSGNLGPSYVFDAGYLLIANGGFTGRPDSVAGFHVNDPFTSGSQPYYGFHGEMAAGSGRYNLYMSGTAQNYLEGALTVNNSVTARFISNGSTPSVTDTTADSCGSGTQTIAGNDNAGKVTVIGSGGTSCTVTFATAFANAPSCSATNETTAALARATSTTSTVILAGVFLQNDVIAYTCLGR